MVEWLDTPGIAQFFLYSCVGGALAGIMIALIKASP